jgi:hypothetical protein
MHVQTMLDPDALVAKVLHPSKAILVVSEHADEQEGFFNLSRRAWSRPFAIPLITPSTTS